MTESTKSADTATRQTIPQKLILARGRTYLMLRVLERFPQIGGITEYMALPMGEKALYEQYTLDAIRTEAQIPVLKIDAKGGGRH